MCVAEHAMDSRQHTSWAALQPSIFLEPGSAFCQLGLQICRYYCVKKLASVEQVRGAAIDCQLGALPLLLKSDCTCTLN